MLNGRTTLFAIGTDRDLSANETGFADQSLTTLGNVYFVRAGRTALVKIGWATDAEKRVEALQTGSCHPLHLLGFMPGSPQDEKAIHYEWADLRERGEWFRLSNDLRHAINDWLGVPGATQFIHVKTDWRAIKRQVANQNGPMKRANAAPGLTTNVKDHADG